MARAYLLSVSVSVFKMQIMLRYTAGNFNEIQACEHLQQFCKLEHASTHLIFANIRAKANIFNAFFPETFMVRAHLPSVSQVTIRETMHQFLFQRCKLCYATLQGILTKIQV